MNIGDIVVDKLGLGKIIGVTSAGNYVIEWVHGDDNELGALSEEQLFLVESASNESQV